MSLGGVARSGGGGKSPIERAIPLRQRVQGTHNPRGLLLCLIAEDVHKPEHIRTMRIFALEENDFLYRITASINTGDVDTLIDRLSALSSWGKTKTIENWFIPVLDRLLQSDVTRGMEDDKVEQLKSLHVLGTTEPPADGSDEAAEASMAYMRLDCVRKLLFPQQVARKLTFVDPVSRDKVMLEYEPSDFNKDAIGLALMLTVDNLLTEASYKESWVACVRNSSKMQQASWEKYLEMLPQVLLRMIKIDREDIAEKCRKIFDGATIRSVKVDARGGEHGDNFDCTIVVDKGDAASVVKGGAEPVVEGGSEPVVEGDEEPIYARNILRNTGIRISDKGRERKTVVQNDTVEEGTFRGAPRGRGERRVWRGGRGGFQVGRSQQSRKRAADSKEATEKKRSKANVDVQHVQQKSMQEIKPEQKEHSRLLANAHKILEAERQNKTAVEDPVPRTQDPAPRGKFRKLEIVVDSSSSPESVSPKMSTGGRGDWPDN